MADNRRGFLKKIGLGTAAASSNGAEKAVASVAGGGLPTDHANMQDMLKLDKVKARVKFSVEQAIRRSLVNAEGKSVPLAKLVDENLTEEVMQTSLAKTQQEDFFGKAISLLKQLPNDTTFYTTDHNYYSVNERDISYYDRSSDIQEVSPEKLIQLLRKRATGTKEVLSKKSNILNAMRQMQDRIAGECERYAANDGASSRLDVYLKEELRDIPVDQVPALVKPGGLDAHIESAWRQSVSQDRRFGIENIKPEYREAWVRKLPAREKKEELQNLYDAEDINPFSMMQWYKRPFSNSLYAPVNDATPEVEEAMKVFLRMCGADADNMQIVQENPLGVPTSHYLVIEQSAHDFASEYIHVNVNDVEGYLPVIVQAKKHGVDIGELGHAYDVMMDFAKKQKNLSEEWQLPGRPSPYLSDQDNGIPGDVVDFPELVKHKGITPVIPQPGVREQHQEMTR